MMFHPSFHELLDTFRVVIASVTWTKFSVSKAKEHFDKNQQIITLRGSVDNRVVSIRKNVLDVIEKEGTYGPAPLYSKTLISYYRILTIAVKDIIWSEPDFSSLLDHPNLQFLYHLRNASAHHNKFYWGKWGWDPKRPTAEWKNKKIKKELEGKKLYMDFMLPADIFFLLEDISKLRLQKETFKTKRVPSSLPANKRGKQKQGF